MAFWSSLLGVGPGALSFPHPDFSPQNGLPFTGDLLISFAVPIVVSFLISVVWIQFKAQQGKTQPVDFHQLRTNIKAYGPSESLAAADRKK